MVRRPTIPLSLLEKPDDVIGQKRDKVTPRTLRRAPCVHRWGGSECLIAWRRLPNGTAKTDSTPSARERLPPPPPPHSNASEGWGASRGHPRPQATGYVGIPPGHGAGRVKKAFQRDPRRRAVQRSVQAQRAEMRVSGGPPRHFPCGSSRWQIFSRSLSLLPPPPLPCPSNTSGVIDEGDDHRRSMAKQRLRPGNTRRWFRPFSHRRGYLGSDPPPPPSGTDQAVRGGRHGQMLHSAFPPKAGGCPQ